MTGGSRNSCGQEKLSSPKSVQQVRVEEVSQPESQVKIGSDSSSSSKGHFVRPSRTKRVADFFIVGDPADPRFNRGKRH